MYLFGLMFFVFRVLFYPMTIWRLIGGYAYLPESYPTEKYWTLVVLSVLYTMLYFLQLFWFYKIIASI